MSASNMLLVEKALPISDLLINESYQIFFQYHRRSNIRRIAWRQNDSFLQDQFFILQDDCQPNANYATEIFLERNYKALWSARYVCV